MHTIRVLLPYDKLGLAAPMRERGSVQVEEYREDGLYLEGIVKTEDLHCFEGYLSLSICSPDANSGCGSQHPLRVACVLLAAAPTATPCIRHWRRSLPLQGIPSPAQLPDGSRVPPSGHLLWETPRRPIVSNK